MSLNHKSAATEAPPSSPPIPENLSPGEFVRAHYQTPPSLTHQVPLRKLNPDGSIGTDFVPIRFDLLSSLEEDACRQIAVRTVADDWKDTLGAKPDAEDKPYYKEALDFCFAAQLLQRSMHDPTTGKSIFINADQIRKAGKIGTEVPYRYYQHTVARLSPTIDEMSEELKEQLYDWLIKGVDMSFFLVLRDKPSQELEFLSFLRQKILALQSAPPSVSEVETAPETER